MKSFILYTAEYQIIQKLTIDQKGNLLDAIYNYALKNKEIELEPTTQLVFDFLKISLDRNAEKYQKIVKRNQDNGKLGGRPRSKIGQKKTKKPSGIKKTQWDKYNPDGTLHDHVHDPDPDPDPDPGFSIEKKDMSYFEKTFKDFSDMRKKIRKPLTARAEELIRMELEKLAPGQESVQIKILEQSIKNSWQGVFSLKEDKNTEKTDKKDEKLTWI